MSPLTPSTFAVASSAARTRFGLRKSTWRTFLLASLMAALACLPLGSIANAGIIEWVTVGDPGNTADTTGVPNPTGAVATSFRIMKYQFTNQLYTDFLNSVAATDTYSLYNASMGADALGGITQSGSPGSYSYSARTNMGDKPVNHVSWFDAARVSNWLMNGALSSSSTETGAYTLVGGQTTGTAPAVNSGATFYVPTEDQRYKAAYYKGGGTNAGYWDYATQSDSAPTAVTAGSTGIGSAGSTGNFANYNKVADWNSQDGNVTTVGTNGGPSFYGAFDMSGNVTEWNDLTGAPGSSRGLRGGGWDSPAASYLSSSSRYSLATFLEGSYIGFRLASPVSGPSGVPEIDPNGLSAALGLLFGGLGLLERRRYSR
jgi:formylglycine-generating enzyme